MRPSGERLTAGRVSCAAALSLVVALGLADCGSPDQAPPAVPHTTASTFFSPFTVTGDHPVPPDGSQDTYTATPGTMCDSTELAQDASVGRKVADGFALAGFPTAAALLQHFLTGKGTAVGGFGPSMRYLQTVCGAPQHAGGAHWFPDTITVTMPLDQPDRS